MNGTGSSLDTVEMPNFKENFFLYISKCEMETWKLEIHSYKTIGHLQIHLYLLKTEIFFVIANWKCRSYFLR